MERVGSAAERLTTAAWFQNLVVAVIVANALVIGVETYSSVHDRFERTFEVINVGFLTFFVIEIALRIVAARCNPVRFFRSGWNVFDFVVVAASFIPGLQSNSTTLRLVRLLRVTRLLKLMPDLKVLLDGLRRAAPPSASLVALTLLIVYLWAIVGWSIFGASVPHRFGNAGESMLTLFTLLTLEGWNEILKELRAASGWGVVYVLSFILVGTFVVLNLVIGVVITSLDEAYGAKRTAEEGADLATAIDAVRTSLDALERTMSGTPGDPRLLSMHDDA